MFTWLLSTKCETKPVVYASLGLLSILRCFTFCSSLYTRWATTKRGNGSREKKNARLCCRVCCSVVVFLFFCFCQLGICSFSLYAFLIRFIILCNVSDMTKWQRATLWPPTRDDELINCAPLWLLPGLRRDRGGQEQVLHLVQHVLHLRHRGSVPLPGKNPRQESPPGARWDSQQPHGLDHAAYQRRYSTKSSWSLQNDDSW